MHRAEADRNLPPPPQQMEGTPSSVSFEQDEDGNSAATPTSGRVVPAGTDSVVIDNSATGISGRWDTFQARLRERRKEAVMGCRTCSIGPAATRGDSADTLKKAI